MLGKSSLSRPGACGITGTLLKVNAFLSNSWVLSCRHALVIRTGCHHVQHRVHLIIRAGYNCVQQRVHLSIEDSWNPMQHSLRCIIRRRLKGKLQEDGSHEQKTSVSLESSRSRSQSSGREGIINPPCMGSGFEGHSGPLKVIPTPEEAATQIV